MLHPNRECCRPAPLRTAARVALALALATTGCGRKTSPEKAVDDELPPWMTDPLNVKLDLAQKLVEQGNPYALGIIRDLRDESTVPPGELDYLQGKALANEGLHAEAERLLLSAEKRLGRDARPHVTLCVLLADMKRMDEALGECERALAIDDELPATWNNYAFLLLTVGRPAEALEAAEKAVDLDSSQVRYRNNLALAQVAVGSVDDALRTFMSTSPRADAHYNVGVAVERFTSPEAARVHYDDALAIDAKHLLSLQALERLNTTTDESTEEE